MTEPRRLALFRVDGSDRIGGGHVIRCLSLAETLTARGFDCLFLAAELTPFLRARVLDAGHQLREIPSGLRFVHGDAAPDAQRADAAACHEALDGERADWTIVDHYGLDGAWEADAAVFSTRLLVVDDLANRRHACDVLVDQTFGRMPEDYHGLVPDHCRILGGSPYALLRRDFAGARSAALLRRQEAHPVERILLSLGTTDPGGLTADLAAAILAAVPDGTLDVVIGATAASRARVEALADTGRVRLHFDVTDMIPLLGAADLAVGAGGGTAWERCCLGLPSVMVVLADNQRLVADTLANAGAACLATSVPEAAAALATLVRDEHARLAMTAAAAAIVDGRGITRVADALLGSNLPTDAPLLVRPASEGDAQAAWLWRNDPGTRAVSQSRNLVPWPDHFAWWQRRRATPDCLLLVAEHGGEPVAIVRFDRLPGMDAGLEVSINLAPSTRGRGLGGRVLAAGIAEAERRFDAIRFEAVILSANAASRRIFAQQGFEPVDVLDTTGFARYVRPARR